MKNLAIEKVIGREILDSRGNPTVEAEVFLADGSRGRGMAPSGASTGEFEALELRDGDPVRFGGKGVLKAVKNINTIIADTLTGMDASNIYATGEFEALELRDGDPVRFGGKGVLKAVKNINTIIADTLTGMDASNIYAVDAAMLRADKTEDKSQLGANAVLAVSIACAKAAAASLGIPLYQFLGGVGGNRLPVPMMNILNGGAHAANTVDVQEFMVMPVGAKSFSEGLRWCTEVFHALKGILKERGLATSVGDEGGFAPDLESDEEAIEVILEAVKKAGYEPERDFVLALDAAASEWKGSQKGEYVLPKSGVRFTSQELVEHWKKLCGKYPVASIEDGLDEEDWEGWKLLTKELGDRIQLVGDDLFVTNTKKLCGKYPVASIEDGLDEEDWEGWKLLTKELGDRIQLVGDDLFVTNTKRLKKGIDEKCGNAILIKLNQIGSVSETMEAVKMAHEAGFSV